MRVVYLQVGASNNYIWLEIMSVICCPVKPKQISKSTVFEVNYIHLFIPQSLCKYRSIKVVFDNFGRNKIFYHNFCVSFNLGLK